MHNCSLMKFKDIGNKYGHLTPIESMRDIPFDIKRVYYITGVGNGMERGFHAHRVLHQVLICLNGSVKIRAKTPKEEHVFILENTSEGLYIGPLIWREMFDFSENTVLLVLASDYFNEGDYIRNYDFYTQEAINLF